MIKIKKINATPVNVPFRIKPITGSGVISDCALVLIDLITNKDIVGRSYLFTFNESMLRPTVDCIDSLNNLIKGRDVNPMSNNIFMRKRLRLLNTSGIMGQALAGLDMALWDAHAKSLSSTMAEVLGGSLEPIQTYNSCGLWIQDPSNISKQAEKLLSESNFKALKIRLGRKNFKDDLLAIKNVKLKIGDEISLMCDFNQSLNLNEAIYKTKILDDLGLYWIEEPIKYDDFEGHAKISSQIFTPLQIGENFVGEFEMDKAIKHMASEYMMPDVQRIGGVTGWLHAASLAHVNDIDLSSHLFPELSIHLLSASPTCHWLEYVDWANPILEEPLKIEDGFAYLPKKPGFGINWNKKNLRKYRL